MPEVKIGSVWMFNKKPAVVTEIIDTKETLYPKCIISVDGENYSVAIADLKPLNGGFK